MTDKAVPARKVRLQLRKNLRMFHNNMIIFLCSRANLRTLLATIQSDSDSSDSDFSIHLSNSRRRNGGSGALVAISSDDDDDTSSSSSSSSEEEEIGAGTTNRPRIVNHFSIHDIDEDEEEEEEEEEEAEAEEVEESSSDFD